MEEKRKIVIPLGSELSTPHFDAEETLLSARPVVPLRSGETREVSRRAPSAARNPFYRTLPFLALIVVAAIGIGTLGGLSIARYQYEQRAAAPVATQTAQAPATDARTATVRTPDTTAQATSVPEVRVEDKSRVEQPAANDVGDVEKAPASRTKVSDEVEDKKAGDKKEDKKKSDDVKTVPPASRDKERTDTDENEISIRAQRRERRRRNNDDDAFNVPRQMERASEQINRIREIFEGRQQRP